MATKVKAKSSKPNPRSKTPKPKAKPRVAKKVPAGGDAEAKLRAYALSLPGAVEEFPWGDRVVKVNKKVFVFMGTSATDGGFGLSAKLPRSASIALTLPFASPTGYGLGKSGWVTARFAAGDKPPLDLLEAWIEESYRAIAPVKLVKQLES
ncbi:MAG TPA: MmcQ/YjbR family DNA-binding protein [Polyangia bacterium]|nr:MmcQ/YjbR family DNA-binding protein [Polyangia bacterium]